MNLFPYQKTEITLNATIPQLIVCLEQYIEPWDPLAKIRQHKLFWGSISSSGFSITRIPKHRGSAGPTINGKFLPYGDQTKIIIESRPLVFIYPIIILVPLFSLFLSWNSFWENEYTRPLTFAIPLGMTLIIFIMGWAGFETGTESIVRELIKITRKYSDSK